MQNEQEEITPSSLLSKSIQIVSKEIDRIAQLANQPAGLDGLQSRQLTEYIKVIVSVNKGQKAPEEDTYEQLTEEELIAMAKEVIEDSAKEKGKKK